MPVSSAVRKRIRALLEPDEEIRYIFPAIAGRFGGREIFFVVTQGSITLIHGGGWRRSQPKDVMRRFPRNTRLGPVDTTLVPSFALGGLVFEVDDQYVSVINAADAEIDSEHGMPPDPLPDL
jgi:hypothetical protein